MKRALSDFSQLSKAMFKSAPARAEVKPEPPKPSKAGDEVLAYFSRSGAGANAQDAQKAPVSAPAADGANARMGELEGLVAALRAQLRDSEAEQKDAVERLEAAERKCADGAAAMAAAQKDLVRLQGECGRLQGELRKAAPLAVPAAETPRGGFLAAPASFEEAFPGEVREIVVSALTDARDTAAQSTRERRATVLSAVLESNRSSGELERRRAKLKQILKDFGYYTDPHALEVLGFRLISGRTHWKLQYANVRMPLAKTPSDFRACLNSAADVANRCF